MHFFFEELKEQNVPEYVLVGILHDRDYMKLVSMWHLVDISEENGKYDEDNYEKVEEFWNRYVVDIDKWLAICGLLPLDFNRRKANVVKCSGLVFPDNTIHKSARKFIEKFGMFVLSGFEDRGENE